MQTRHQNSTINIFLKWTGLTSLCFAVGLTYYFSSIRPDALFLTVTFIALGLLQWSLVLRQRLNNVVLWTYVTGMGYILSFVVYYMLDQLTRPLWISTGLANSTPTIDAVRGVIGGAVIGFSIGIPQWYVVLRINKIRNAAWWIPATVLAYGIGLGIASLFYTLAKSARWDAFFGGSLNMPVVVLGAVLGSLVIGVITGVTIAWLLRNHSVEQNVDSAQQLTSTATP